MNIGGNFLAAWKMEEKNVPVLQDFKELRSNKQSWIFLCDNILPCVIGATKHKQHIQKDRVTSFTSETDFAFIILVLENYWDLWWAIHNNDEQDGKEEGGTQEVTMPLTLWTSSSSLSGQNAGWDEKANVRYNELIALELQDRANGEQADDEYLNYQARKNSRKRKIAHLVRAKPLVSYVSAKSKLGKI